jgi:hypothetical protein
MPINWRRRRPQQWRLRAPGPAVKGNRLVGNVIKFPDDGRIVRFGHAETEESATIIILPVVRIERSADAPADDGVEPHTHPPAANGGGRRMRRR